MVAIRFDKKCVYPLMVMSTYADELAISYSNKVADSLRFLYQLFWAIPLKLDLNASTCMSSQINFFEAFLYY